MNRIELSEKMINEAIEDSKRRSCERRNLEAEVSASLDNKMRRINQAFNRMNRMIGLLIIVSLVAYSIIIYSFLTLLH